MKIMIYGDVHWCESSSIVRGMGRKYSQRLENLIRSVTWVESMAYNNGCELIIMLGDFFDKSILTAQEVSALNDILWSDIKKIFLTGNHEIGRADRTFSTIDLFDSFPNSEVISQPVEMNIANKKGLFLPYFLEKDRPDLSKYDHYDYIFSHNDIKGLQLGPFISKEGFEIEKIENSCTYYFNGHIHNGMFVGKNIINIGNLSGQNFSEDALNYSHNVVILDTETDNLEFFENPNAFNFYKLGLVTSSEDLKSLKSHAVVSMTLDTDNKDLKQFIENDDRIVCKRILYKDNSKSIDIKEDFSSVDYLQKFVEFVKNNMEMTDMVEEELSKVIV